MYPFLRMAAGLYAARKQGPMGILDTHYSRVTCMPWDLDIMNELNNGRTLTLFDLGRVPMAHRAGLLQMLKKKRWSMTVAGSSIRYRRRVQAFARLEMRTHLTCWDDRFFYVEQSMWRKDGECTAHAMLRTAVVGKNGIVPTSEVADALGYTGERPEVPGWIEKWAISEQDRPWPPMPGTDLS